MVFNVQHWKLMINDGEKVSHSFNQFHELFEKSIDEGFIRFLWTTCI